MILSNDFQAQWDDIGSELTATFEAVGRSAWYILGAEVQAFETNLAHFWGLRHAVGVASGLDALEIGLRLLGCGPDDKVLTSPVSAFATVLAIVRTGATPVFAACDSQGLIDLHQCEEILREDRNIRFCCPVHLYGHALDLHRLQHLRDEYGLSIVEDCAQSIGASWRGRPTGSVGQIAATSFYPTKNLGALGDGGALLTNDAELATKARVLRDYGQTAKYRHEVIGCNSRLDELQAAILHRVALPRLPQWTARRRQIARKYLDSIAHPGIALPVWEEAAEPTWHLFAVRIANGRKQDFMDHMRAHGVATAEHYPVALMDQPAMSTVRFLAPRGVSQARSFCASQVSLPIHPYLSDKDVETVAAACNAWDR